MAALTAAQLLLAVLLGLAHRALVPAVGLAIVFRGALGDAARFVGLPPERARSDAGAGVAVFAFAAVIYVVGFYAAKAIVSPEEFARAGRPLEDASAFLAILLSLQAGFGEELLFRGVAQAYLLRRLPWSGAIATQALLFGVAHATYGSVLPMAASAALGLLMGLVAWRLGLAAAMVLHAAFDITQFALRLQDPILLIGTALLVAAGAAVLIRTRAAALRRLLAPLPPLRAPRAESPL